MKISARAGRRVSFDGTSLSPARQVLYSALSTKRLRHALSRFIHYANRSTVSPEQVNAEFLAWFAADLEASGEVANVHLRHRETAVSWNQCSRMIASWLHTVLPEPRIDRVRRNLAWSEFPATSWPDSGRSIDRQYQLRLDLISAAYWRTIKRTLEWWPAIEVSREVRECLANVPLRAQGFARRLT